MDRDAKFNPDGITVIRNHCDRENVLLGKILAAELVVGRCYYPNRLHSIYSASLSECNGKRKISDLRTYPYSLGPEGCTPRDLNLQGSPSWYRPLNRHNRASRKAKRDSSKEFSQALKVVPECSRIGKFLARERPSRIGTLSKSAGTKTETEEQFRGEWKELSPQVPDSRAWKVDWNLARKTTQVSKILWPIEPFRSFKSAGIDIFPGLLQQSLDLLSSLLCTLLRATLVVDHLPSSWREARGILLVNGASSAKTWSRTNAHRVYSFHAKQQNSSCIYEPLQYKGDGGSRLPTGWWIICCPIFEWRVSTRWATPMILPSWSAGVLRAWYPKGCKSHWGS
ncbi:hypothetical protein Trydic_g21415 [Trypoxylus dichotomus]